jgi:hypothetical protein
MRGGDALAVSDGESDIYSAARTEIIIFCPSLSHCEFMQSEIQVDQMPQNWNIYQRLLRFRFDIEQLTRTWSSLRNPRFIRARAKNLLFHLIVNVPNPISGSDAHSFNFAKLKYLRTASVVMGELSHRTMILECESQSNLRTQPEKVRPCRSQNVTPFRTLWKSSHHDNDNFLWNHSESTVNGSQICECKLWETLQKVLCAVFQQFLQLGDSSRRFVNEDRDDSESFREKLFYSGSQSFAFSRSETVSTESTVETPMVSIDHKDVPM